MIMNIVLINATMKYA